MRNIKLGGLALFAVFLGAMFSGCGGVKSMLKKKEALQKPQMFVFPFDCDCVEVTLSSSVTTGFMKGLPESVEPLDLQGFESYLTTAGVTMADVTGEAPPTAPSAPAESLDPSAPPPMAEPAPPVSINYSVLVANLFTKRAARERFHKTTGIEYLVIGRAKERKLSSLEAGNLITVQTADIKVMDAKTGEIIVDDSFKQGGFEIVAADRVGKKLAAKVIDKFKEIAKDAKRQRKLEKQREKRRRALKD